MWVLDLGSTGPSLGACRTYVSLIFIGIAQVHFHSGFLHRPFLVFEGHSTLMVVSAGFFVVFLIVRCCFCCFVFVSLLFLFVSLLVAGVAVLFFKFY